jgi:magnesium transporter
MLTAYPSAAAGGAQPIWLDLLDPSDAEKAAVAKAYGIEVPARSDLSEIETSSRIADDNGTLYLSMPIISPGGDVDTPPTPLGFVLSKELLTTVRFTPLRSFEQVAGKFASPAAPRSPAEAFAAIVEAMVELSADLLEVIGTELDDMSRAVFPRRAKRRRRRETQSNDALRALLIDVGNIGERASRVRDILLGLQRIVPFVADTERDWIAKATRDELKTSQSDLLSLIDYEVHLSNKVQFLLDAVLGLINTKQNDIFTVLTVVSVVGIPPTLVASIYGMNFKNMPELSWAYGYQWGLGLIVLSTILPILWFKWRGWL